LIDLQPKEYSHYKPFQNKKLCIFFLSSYIIDKCKNLGKKRDKMWHYLHPIGNTWELGECIRYILENVVKTKWEHGGNSQI
jgi:hypothetical protein